MGEILGKAKTVRELLKGEKYSIDFYQREYRWQEKQIRELIEDLSNKFLEEYQPEHARSRIADYPHYFLGATIVSKKEGASFLVDGQQRLTSLTLLLIYLRTLQEGRRIQVNIDELIFSERYGQKSFNLQVDERIACMEALYEGQPFDLTDRSESVQNLYRRYNDIEAFLPEELRDSALPYFIDWLLENVHLVEITAYSDEDAYTIFETMNDRGLSLTPTEMLKGYLLANIEEGYRRNQADVRWRGGIQDLNEVGKETEADFFKAWFRSQYATRIRERRRGASPEDFDRIGTEYHRWLREASETIGLGESTDFFQFIDRNFDFYSRQYIRLMESSQQLSPGLERVLYNSQLGFTLQYMLLLAPLQPADGDRDIEKKLQIVSHFVDILLAWRIWNSRSIAYSTMQYAMFLVMTAIRGLDVEALSRKLHDTLLAETATFSSGVRLRVHQQNRYPIHRLLARLTDFVETRSGVPSRYLEYVIEGRNRNEVEHIWADHPERHTDEISHAADFAEQRNRIGGLLLLPRSFNGSYGDLPYEQKLPHYLTQNLLARSLHPQCYERNPGFLHFVQSTGLPFKPYEHFRAADVEERSELYRRIAEVVWHPDDLLHQLEA